MKRPTLPRPNWVLGLTIVALGGCAGNGDGTADSKAALLKTQWILVAHGTLMEQLPLEDGIEITLTLTPDNQIFGTTGCNSYQGTYVANGNNLQIGTLGSTKRACPGTPNAMALEQRFLSSLGGVTRFAISEDSLTLHNSDGKNLVFRGATL